MYLKTTLAHKDILIEVGAGVVVKKTPEQALEIIESQVKKLHEVRSHVLAQKEMCMHALRQTIETLETDSHKKV